jgi:hypothetical protein
LATKAPERSKKFLIERENALVLTDKGRSSLFRPRSEPLETDLGGIWMVEIALEPQLRGAERVRPPTHSTIVAHFTGKKKV